VANGDLPANGGAIAVRIAALEVGARDQVREQARTNQLHESKLAEQATRQALVEKGQDDLVEDVKGLREEIAALRKESAADMGKVKKALWTAVVAIIGFTISVVGLITTILASGSGHG